MGNLYRINKDQASQESQSVGRNSEAYSAESPAAEICLYDLEHAWRSARRKKRPSHNRLAFEARWMERLIELRKRLAQGRWRPSPAACFITLRPKAREIHAPDFSDRVVHHWLVPRLERLYEPVFIHDCHANRKGHGTHAAVERLQGMMRQVVDGECGRGCANKFAPTQARAKDATGSHPPLQKGVRWVADDEFTNDDSFHPPLQKGGRGGFDGCAGCV